MKTRINTTMAVVASVALAAVVVFGGWQLGWWFTAQNVNKSGHIVRTSYEAQKTYRDEITRQITTVTSIDVQVADPGNKAMKSALTNQRQSVVDQICQIATNLTSTDLPPSIFKFVVLNCPEGTVK